MPTSHRPRSSGGSRMSRRRLRTHRPASENQIEAKEETSMTKTIVLIHGAWLNSKAWEKWKPRYEQRGYTVIAPDWPGDEGDPVELKAHPRMELTKYGPKEIVAHYERII